MPDYKQILINTLWSLAADEQGGYGIWSALASMEADVPDFVQDYSELSQYIACELGAQYCDGTPVADEEYKLEWEKLKAEYAND